MNILPVIREVFSSHPPAYTASMTAFNRENARLTALIKLTGVPANVSEDPVIQATLLAATGFEESPDNDSG